MKIDDDHMYYGAGLMQIAEHPRFTAINPIKLCGRVSRCGFRINADIGLFLKYRSAPVSVYDEYHFLFNADQRRELAELNQKTHSTLLALVCVKDREICCISYGQFEELVERRKRARQCGEENYVVVASLPPGKSFRVYVNPPGSKGRTLGKPLVVARKGFPDLLFR